MKAGTCTEYGSPETECRFEGSILLVRLSALVSLGLCAVHAQDLRGTDCQAWSAAWLIY